MRNPDRIDPFLQKLGAIWKKNAPDWRFGQLVENVFSESKYMTFYMEENRMLTEFNNYFNKGKKTRRRKDEPRGRNRSKGINGDN